MAKKTYVSPGIMLLQTGGDGGTGNGPFSQFDPDKPKGNQAKETVFDEEEYDTDLWY